MAFAAFKQMRADFTAAHGHEPEDDELFDWCARTRKGNALYTDALIGTTRGSWTSALGT